MARTPGSEGSRGLAPPDPPPAPGRSAEPRARLFLALDPPPQTRRALASWRDGLVAGRDDLRPVGEQALHVTLVFLGWMDEHAAPRVAEIAAAAAEGHPAPVLEPIEVKPLPPRRPRLFALSLDDRESRCGLLQGALEESLAAARLHRPERRPFWPHITLARVRKGARAADLRASGDPPRGFTAGRLVLYRSTLHPQGAVYDALAEVELPDA